jgi:hypothetical protein
MKKKNIKLLQALKRELEGQNLPPDLISKVDLIIQDEHKTAGLDRESRRFLVQLLIKMVSERFPELADKILELLSG